MLVVADSSPLIVLIDIGHIGVLPRLFGQVIIPPEVAGELHQSNRPQAVHDFIASRPAWLLERAPAAIEPIPALHAGELAAISLAQELKADLLLIDEVRGRKAAADRHIPFTGTIGVLELAAPRTDPYERNYRIRLLPWMGNVKSHVRVWMQDMRPRNPPFEGQSQPVPPRPPPLATTAQYVPPQHA